MINSQKASYDRDPDSEVAKNSRFQNLRGTLSPNRLFVMVVLKHVIRHQNIHLKNIFEILILKISDTTEYS